MWRRILKTTLLAGSLDITAAFIQVYLAGRVTPGIVLKYIASGVFGKEAFAGGYGMMSMGLLFHFTIAFACTVIFFMLYTKLKFLHHHILLNSILIALIAWAVTRFIIIPFSNTAPPAKFDFAKAVVAIGILVVCIGLPLSISAKRFYFKNS